MSLLLDWIIGDNCISIQEEDSNDLMSTGIKRNIEKGRRKLWSYNIQKYSLLNQLFFNSQSIKSKYNTII